jgi:hypothetical protein
MENKATDQISINFQYPYQYNRESLFNYNMLIDDLSFNKYRYSNGEINFDLESDNVSEAMEKIIEKFELCTDSWRNLNTNNEILDFFILISNTLIYDGICCFERISSVQNNKLESIIKVKGDIRKKNGFIIQKLPKEVGNKSVRIPSNKCHVLEFPEEICTTTEYLNIMKKIRAIDSKDPILSILNPSPLNKIKDYDAFKHKKYLELILWKITKKISWHHRSNFSQKEDFSNYYTILRDLNFKKNKLILMNHVFRFIEKMINEEIEGVKLSITFTKSIDDIELLINNFKIGHFKTDEYLKTIKDYN